MKIWITGSAGFLGTKLVRALWGLGHEVTGFDRLPTTTPDSRSVVLDLTDTHSSDRFQEQARDSGRPDVVVHLASLQPSSIRTVRDYVSGNVLTSAALADALRKTGFCRCLYTSSVSVYGAQPISPIHESQAPNPDHPYGITKLAAEGLLKTLQPQGQVFILRLASLFGVGQGDSLLNGFLRRARANEPIRLLSRGSLRRDVLYVDDAVNAIKACLDCSLPNPVCTLNLGSGDALTVREYASRIVKVVGSSSPVLEVDQPAAPAYDQSVDLTAARRLIGFQPLPLATALERYLHELPS